MQPNNAHKQEMQRKVKEFVTSGLTRRQFSDQHGIPFTTLDYWRRVANRKPRLVEVEVAVEDREKVEGETGPGFTITLGNGRRIESNWRFTDAGLSRLIRVAENA